MRSHYWTCNLAPHGSTPGPRLKNKKIFGAALDVFETDRGQPYEPSETMLEPLRRRHA